MTTTGHGFEVMHVHDETGEISVRWDGQDSRMMTCRIPFGDDGEVLPDKEFKVAIMHQCLDRLEHWDRTQKKPLTTARALVGRRFDVTEEFTLRNVKLLPTATENEDEGFSLKDYV